MVTLGVEVVVVVVVTVGLWLWSLSVSLSLSSSLTHKQMQLCFGGPNPGNTNALWLSDFWPLCEQHVDRAGPPLEIRVGAFQKSVIRHPSVFSAVRTLRLAVAEDLTILHAIADLPGQDVFEKGYSFAAMFCNQRSSSLPGNEWLRAYAGFDGFVLPSVVEVHPCDYLDYRKRCEISVADVPNALASIAVMYSFCCS